MFIKFHSVSNKINSNEEFLNKHGVKQSCLKWIAWNVGHKIKCLYFPSISKNPNIVRKNIAPHFEFRIFPYVSEDFVILCVLSIHYFSPVCSVPSKFDYVLINKSNFPHYIWQQFVLGKQVILKTCHSDLFNNVNCNHLIS